MEENVALDSSKQKKFIKSIKGIKKLIKKNDAATKPVNEEGNKVKKGRVTKKRKERGLVYLSHIPHGFYEHQMTQYFKQFGVVTNARVIRSKRTGRSKGFAFVEFKEPAVADIVAETMNNYLMGKRLIKASCIPHEKQRRAFRKRWSTVNNPGIQMTMKIKKMHNEDKNEHEELKRARKQLSNINKTKKKLNELGINYDFFTPVDIPEAIVNNAVKKENEDSQETTKAKSRNKKGIEDVEPKSESKAGKVKVEDSKEKIKNNKNKPKENVGQKDVAASKIKTNKVELSTISKKQEKLAKKAIKDENNSKTQIVVDKKAQKQKKDSLKSKGVKPLQDFIKFEQDEDSDSSADFDSDEFEKLLLENDDLSDESDEGSSNEDNEENDTGSAESEEEQLPKKRNNEAVTKVQNNIGKKGQVNGSRLPQQEKRKATQQSISAAPETASKKPKFEKQINQKQKNKQFKKKK